jgi:hypothetical protein
MVRAKFTVSNISKSYYAGANGEPVEGSTYVTLTPQYDSSIEEDRRYAKATPSGEIRLQVDNPPAVEYLKPGQQFYVDFTKVEDT